MLSKGRDYYVELGGRYLVNNRSSQIFIFIIISCPLFLHSCCLKYMFDVSILYNQGQSSTLMKLNISHSPSVGLDCQILGLGPLIRLWKQVASFIGILILKGIGSFPPSPHKSSHIIIIFKVHSSGFGISLHQCYRH